MVSKLKLIVTNDYEKKRIIYYSLGPERDKHFLFLYFIVFSKTGSHKKNDPLDQIELS